MGIRIKPAWCHRRVDMIRHRQPLPPTEDSPSPSECLRMPIHTYTRLERLRIHRTMQASQPHANRSTMAPTIKIVRRQSQEQPPMVQQQTVDRQAVAMQHLIQMATKTFGIPREAMALQTRHLFVHPLAHQIRESAATSMHRAEAQWVAPVPPQPVVHGTPNVQSAHQPHNQPHQQVYIRITRSIHGWLLQVSDLCSFPSSYLRRFYCVSLNCGLMLYTLLLLSCI